MWQCKWLNLVDNLRTLEVMSPDDQILIRFATNQKMHIEWNTNYVDSKKYRKYDVKKYKNISNKILQSERADLIDMSPDFDFCMKRLDVFMHILDSR